MSDAASPRPASISSAVAISPAARTFVVTTTAASLAAFDLGFDLGAFSNIDHRKIWAMWVLCTVALVASYLFRDQDYRLGGRWRFVLAVPSLWLLADLSFASSSQTVITILFALYILVRLVAGDFVALPSRLRIALVATALAVFCVGWYVGEGHPRFLSCDDFARSGEFVPENCAP